MSGVRIRSELAAIPAYQPGRPAPIGPDGSSWKLSSNENPYPPLPAVVERTAQALTELNRYPDMANTELTGALSDDLGIAPDRIALGAGSVSVIGHLVGAICQAGDQVIYAWRSFEAYPIITASHAAVPVEVPVDADGAHDLDRMRAAITDQTKIIIVCTPNNPTGPAIGHDQLSAFIAQVPDDVMIMIDEAYAEFVTDPAAARGLELAAQHPNVVTLRTFSKAYGLAGMRVGYAVGDPRIMAAARALNPPFAISLPSQAAAVASLAEKSELFARVKTITAERDRLLGGLREIPLGLEIPDSQANFIWLPALQRTRAWAEEFAKAGVMVRAFANDQVFDGLRISIGDPAANRRILEVAQQLQNRAR